MKNPSTLVDDETRKRIAADRSIGAGNFFQTVLATNPSPEEPILHLEKPLRSFTEETFATLSCIQIDLLAKLYAGFYKSLGVAPQDTVFVYLDDGVEYLIHYLALVELGAIGVLTNGNMPPEIALKHARNTGVVGVFTDSNHEAVFRRHADEFRFVLRNDEIQVDPASLPSYEPYVHDAEDPIMIAHSSGTTGIPKAVLLQHEKFFFGPRYRMTVPRVPGGETILSSLPHSHNCAISYLMVALLSGTPVYITSDHTGASVLSRIAAFRPKMVVSFPQTFVEITECDLDAYDLSSVRLWYNGGDAAHEPHIRALLRHGSREIDGRTVRGSVFIDGMGSSEMGFSLFRNVHTPETENYGRCVGKPLEWVDAQILSEDGKKLGPMQIGRLGVKAPSVTSGYWNNSSLTFKSRLSGYFLTGDLAYRDEQGRFFHVDRTPDVIRTVKGFVYGLKTEEFLMSRFPAIADCTVFGRTPERSALQIPVVRVRVRPNTELSDATETEVLKKFNLALSDSGMPIMEELKLSNPTDIPLGSTGKVLKRELRVSEVTNANS